VLGDDHPDTLHSAHNLAHNLRAVGAHVEAHALFKDTLARFRAALGEDHPATLTSANNLAAALTALEEHQQALALHEETLARRRRVLGEDHPDTLTSAGNLAVGLHRIGEHVRARAELGLLNDEAAEWTQARAERAELVSLLRAEGLLSTDSADSGDGEEQIVVAMHALLARTPCRLLLASPYDVVGETRQPNLPGTVDEYPNWRLPLPVTLEQLQRDPRVGKILAALRPAASGIGDSMEP
jgi:tetratricopeptide (TPR) repeat protein